MTAAAGPKAAWSTCTARLNPDTTDTCYTWWSNRGQAGPTTWAGGWTTTWPRRALAAKARREKIYLDQRFSDHAPLIIDYDFKLSWSESLSSSRLLDLYRLMRRIRAFEDAAETASQGGVAAWGLSASAKPALVRGPLHLSTGQEAVAAGVCINLQREDLLTSTHRGHGHTLAKGANAATMMCELFGRATGYNKGKGGSMHIADFSVGMLGANGVVAAGIPSPPVRRTR
jgi:hypothetical protein